MATLRYFTAGESHGPALLGILEGMPAGLVLEPEGVNKQLQRRQQGYGRGGRMDIERDEAIFLSGLRFGQTTGAPLALMIHNRDWPNWKEQMDPLTPPPSSQPVTVPRPGHADLTGALKYGHDDLRDVIERASARETAIRVALGAVARQLLESLGVVLASHVCQIHQVQSEVEYSSLLAAPQEINARADASPLRCLAPEAESRMIATIDEAKETGNTVGGIFEVLAFFVPAGLGSYVQWDRRLDGQIAQAFLSIPGIKGMEIGLGFAASGLWGSEVQDEIFLEQDKGLHHPTNRAGDLGALRQEGHQLAAARLHRPTNRAGGIEGGISNGEPILVRAAMKPISTLNRPLHSIDLQTREPTRAHRERSDVCAVPAASVMGEAVLALVLAAALLEKFGGDSMSELTKHLSCQQGLQDKR